MKNKILSIGAYIFGAIGILLFGYLAVTPVSAHFSKQKGDAYHVVVFLSSIASLRFFWIRK